MIPPIPVIGAGLAGAEAAWQLAEAGLEVRLHEMRPQQNTPAHETAYAAELVCSNSLGSSAPDRAAGVLMAELDRLGSFLLSMAQRHALPAGTALAVDRVPFAAAVTDALEKHPRIEFVRGEVDQLPEDPIVLLATGPLTSELLARDLARLTGREHLSFFDAVAPVVTAESLDPEVVFVADRWGRGSGDYRNIPLERKDYEQLVDALLDAERHDLRAFEQADPRASAFFERCLPVEVLAARGRDTLRFGPLRPVGLDDPRTGRRPYAVLQLRAENRAATLYNLVGFQTMLRHGEQTRVLRALPGLARAEFARLGSIHRNTYLDSPMLLDATLAFRERPGLFVAGQLTGMEGYLANIASGVLAARNATRYALGQPLEQFPRTTLLGGLAAHIAESPNRPFQPLKAAFGVLPPPTTRMKRAERPAFYAERSAADLAHHCHEHPLPAPDGAHA